MIARRIAPVVCLISIACASGSLPVEEPVLRVAQIHSPRFLQERGGLMSVDYLIEVTNPGEEAITAERVEIQSVGGGPYSVRPTPIELKKVIEPGRSEVLEVSAWAYSSGGLTASSEPVTLRVTVRFVGPGGPFQITKVERIQQN